jgi:hypothetical protein
VTHSWQSASAGRTIFNGGVRVFRRQVADLEPLYIEVRPNDGENGVIE